jgi:hypothetical protein
MRLVGAERREGNAGRWRVAWLLDGESSVGVFFTIARPNGTKRIAKNSRLVTILIAYRLQLNRVPPCDVAPNPTED